MRFRLLALLSLLFIVSPLAGHAQVDGVRYALIARTSVHAADVAGQSQDDGANIHLWSYVNAPNQHWLFEDEGNGYYRVKASHSGKYMSVGSEAGGASAIQQSRRSSDLQLWRVEHLPNGFSSIINKESGKALSVFGGEPGDLADLVQSEYFGNINQQFRLFSAEISIAAENASLTNRTNLGPDINSECGELGPLPTLDDSTMYMSVVWCAGNIEGAGGKGGDIWYSERTPGGAWGPSVRLDGIVNNDQANAVAGLTADGNSMLLMGTYEGDGRYSPNGLSISNRTDSGWGEPEPIEIADFYSFTPPATYMLLPSGKGIIMSLERTDGYGSNDLYISERLDDGSWGAPENLGMGVNSQGYEFGAFLAADLKTLYFASWGWPGYGQADLFMSRRLDDSWTNWAEARNLGPSVNTAEFEGSFVISGDGTHAYISSANGAIGQSDIFSVDLPDALRPDPVVLVSGTVVDGNTDQPIAARVAYERLRDRREVGVGFTTTERGFSLALPKGEMYGVYASSPGYYAVAENSDLTSLEAFQQIEITIRMLPLEVGVPIRLNNIFFDTGAATLRPESFAELDRLVETLELNPDIAIEVGGHTDATGSADANLSLSQQRAASVVDYLIAGGIASSRLQSQGFGQDQPVASNETDEGRQLNRRVEFRIRE